MFWRSRAGLRPVYFEALKVPLSLAKGKGSREKYLPERLFAKLRNIFQRPLSMA
jgi:hypothetical protein